MNWFIQALKKTFTYRGRARRAELGWFNLISFLISLALIIVPAVVFNLGGNLLAATYQSEAISIITNAGTLIFGLAYSLFSLVTTLAHFSLSARRRQRFTNKYGEDPKTEPVEQTPISVLVDKP